MRRCSARDTCCTGSSCPGSRAWWSRAWRRGGCSAPCLASGSNDHFVGRLGQYALTPGVARPSPTPARTTLLQRAFTLGVGTGLPRYRGMHLDEERLYLLLDRYLAGEASAADADVVREWLAEDAEHALLLTDLRLIKRVASERPPPTSADAAWVQAVKTLGVGRKPRVSRRLLMVALAAAAGFLPPVGGGGGGWAAAPRGGKWAAPPPRPVIPPRERA